uniref:Uncharacterized protein n=1 Tax=Arundo donax TaxID=35708 RepID=A0A0A9F0Y0_ARUDO
MDEGTAAEFVFLRMTHLVRHYCPSHTKNAFLYINTIIIVFFITECKYKINTEDNKVVIF